MPSGVRVRLPPSALSKIMDMELMDLRDELSFRRAKGEELTKVELAIIELVDELFDAAYPGPPGLPQEVLDAMEEVKRLRGAS